MFFYIVLTPISTTSGLCGTGNMRKDHQIDVYIYQCDIDVWVRLVYIPRNRVWAILNTTLGCYGQLIISYQFIYVFLLLFLFLSLQYAN